MNNNKKEQKTDKQKKKNYFNLYKKIKFYDPYIVHPALVKVNY